MRRTDWALALGSVTHVRAYPFAAHTMASATPRFPEVDSMSRVAGKGRPVLSASATSATAVLSFTEPAGLRPSIFRKTELPGTSSSARMKRSSRIRSYTSSAITGIQGAGMRACAAAGSVR